MRSVYEEESIPLQVRRLMIFDEICRKAQKYPDEIIHLSRFTQLAFGVMYLQDFKKFIAFGGIFEYAHTRKEVIEQGVHCLLHDELIMCAITVKRQAFTKPVRKPIELLWHWNNYVKNRRHTYLDNDVQHFFPVNDELEMDYPPHRYHKCLVATMHLPLWDNQKTITTPAYFDREGHLRPKGYLKKRLV
ncbi:hypothetical protein [Psychrobacter sp. CAL346-MNA-CIBAN-0220]|uniref:hypothetical protein n=1 Tax=Psychrobacter sp. CAL346-MNA-CIBAN-0220 TaxID=3140457 RepID=UPI003323C453